MAEWRSSGVLNLPYIFKTLKRVYKPTVGISTKLSKNEQFLSKHGLWLQRESGVDLSDIYVWRMGSHVSTYLGLFPAVNEIGRASQAKLSSDNVLRCKVR